jgi:hypothetical protein
VCVRVDVRMCARVNIIRVCVCVCMCVSLFRSALEAIRGGLLVRVQ